MKSNETHLKWAHIMSLSKIFVNTQDTGFEGIPLQQTGHSTTVAMSQKAVTDELEKIPYKQSETGMSSGGQYSMFQTSTIQIPNGSWFAINDNSPRNEQYIIWSDGSFKAISKGTFYKIEYPEGKTFIGIRTLVGADVVMEVTIDVINCSEYWKDLLTNINGKVSKSELLQALGTSTTLPMSQKAVTDIINIINNVAPLEQDNYSFIETADSDIYSYYLKSGNIINISLSYTDRSSEDIFGKPSDGSNWVNLGSLIAGAEISITLDRDYAFIRVGGGAVHTVSGSYSIESQLVNNINKISDFAADEFSVIKDTVYRDLDVYDILADATEGPGDICSTVSDKLKQGTNIIVENLSDSGSFEIYCYRSTDQSSFEGYGSVLAGESKVITLTKDYYRIKAYSTQQQHCKMSIKYSEGALSGEIDNLQKEIDRVKSSNLDIQSETGTSSGGQYSQFNTSTIQIPNGARFKTNHNSPRDEQYIMWNDGSFIAISKNTVYTMEYPEGKTFRCLRILPGDDVVIDITVEVTFVPEEWEDEVKNIVNHGGFELPVIRALILGDSYSAYGGTWVGPMMEKLPLGSSWISLAVGSASLKDHYQDRETYPYTSRPVSNVNSGNLNTVACQIQKLKRLMAGTDLDAGETPIYQTEDSYPNVIIIAGGKNDNYDSDEVVATYHAQLNKSVNNVYRKRLFSDEEPELGSVTIKTPIDEVNRCCFAGSYRYLMEELLALFPNANIYFATISPISYRAGGDISARSVKILEQQRLCADIFSANLIDWYRNGQINSIMNYAQGSGTENDPYIWGECNLPYCDANDQLHPNARGGRKYGICAAHTIINTFIEIE